MNTLFNDEMFYLSSDKNIDEEVEKIFSFYRTAGFPDYNKENYSIEKEYNRMVSFDTDKIVDGNKIKQNVTGNGFLWSYFPHWKDIICGISKKSLNDIWNTDDNAVKELIKKTYIWKLKHNEPHWTNNRIRQNAKVFLAKQTVSNFHPTVAKYIYNQYGNKGTVLDMSSGFGGRLFGFFSSDCRKYIRHRAIYKNIQWIA